MDGATLDQGFDTGERQPGGDGGCFLGRGRHDDINLLNRQRDVFTLAVQERDFVVESIIVEGKLWSGANERLCARCRASLSPNSSANGVEGWTSRGLCSSPPTVRCSWLHCHECQGENHRCAPAKGVDGQMAGAPDGNDTQLPRRLVGMGLGSAFQRIVSHPFVLRSGSLTS